MGHRTPLFITPDLCILGCNPAKSARRGAGFILDWTPARNNGTVPGIRMPVPIWIGPQSFPAHRYSTPGLGYRAPLANGDQGTAQTISVMRRLAEGALRDSNFVRKVSDIVRPVAAFDDVGEVKQIYDWVRRNIRFTKDPVTVEKLYPPQELLKIRSGDCDDLALLTAAMAMTIGYPARWITISTNAESPNEFTHIWTEVEAPPGSGNWVAMDTARLDSNFGLEPAMYFRKRAWDVASDHYVDLAGNKRRMPKFLSGYNGLGQDGIDWTPIVSQSISEIPAITAAVAGRGSATSPYASYATPYTPGYGIPAAGYTAPGAYPYGATSAGISLSPGTLMLLAGAFLIFMLARK